MKVASLFLIPAVAAVPSLWPADSVSVLAPDNRDVQGEPDIQGTPDSAEQASNAARSWTKDGRELVRRGGNVYERVVHSDKTLDGYQLRVTSTVNGTLANPTICDPSVKQTSGYLDINDDKHLFFWFFEARNEPETAPLVLWLNGGPGCSSSNGLFMELGPCRIAEGGQSTTVNEHSWNTHFNLLFLDQPSKVGYSYQTGGDPVTSTPVAADDVYAMLQLFLDRFPTYRERPFHIAAESYGGRYAPSIASAIFARNADPSNALPRINLQSIALGNGITDPRTQFPSNPEYACEGPYALWDPASSECALMREKAAECERAAGPCYDTPSTENCLNATVPCWSEMYKIFEPLKLNGYDVRMPCDKEKDGSMCYHELGWIATYLNLPETKRAVGAEESVEFVGCSPETLGYFFIEGDMMHNTAALIPPLLDAGLRVLVYAGNADFMCNFIGNERWMERLDGHALAADFARAEKKPWTTLSDGRTAGKVRAAGGGAGNLTFVEVHEAGHMMPYDQPEAALDMIERWVFDISLAD